MTTQDKGTALITGASSGIGAVYADRLARRGYDLIIVARNRNRLDGLARRLTDETERSVEVLTADLNCKADLSRVEDALKSDSSITMLVNNAGIGTFAPLLESDADKMEEMIFLNICALTRLTYAVAPRFVARGTGTIINISSVARSGDAEISRVAAVGGASHFESTGSRGIGLGRRAYLAIGARASGH